MYILKIYYSSEIKIIICFTLKDALEEISELDYENVVKKVTLKRADRNIYKEECPYV